jgi:hypothetical protein
MATNDVWQDEECPRCEIPRRDHPMCTFTVGTLECANGDSCPNWLHHPENRPPVKAPTKVPSFRPRKRATPHCGHGGLIEDRDSCLYCLEAIAPGDFYEMMRWLRQLRRERRRKRDRLAPVIYVDGRWLHLERLEFLVPGGDAS